MATIRFTGLDEYIAKLEQLTSRSRGICKMAVWEGGKVVGDSVKNALHNIPVQDHYVPEGTKRTGITQKQKDGIISGYGLSKMRDDRGSISTKIGFHGTTEGMSNKGLMRNVESGTSYMRKHPIIRPTVNMIRGEAEKAMEEKLTEETQRLMQ